MKPLTALQPQSRRRNSSPLDTTTVETMIKYPTKLFWIAIHFLCCIISLLLGFRFSRLFFFLFFTTILPHFPNSSPVRNTSHVVVGRHGILVRPFPHPDQVEVMKAHRIIERVQMEQSEQNGVKRYRTVIVITPTYVRTFQTLHLTGVMHSLMNVRFDVVWIVVEAGGTTNETANLIGKCEKKVIHVGFDEKMPVLWEDRHRLEAKMRLYGLRVVREQRLDGIVIFADDSNMHSLELFDEIQNVEWIGSISVGILAHSGGPEDGELRNVERDGEEDEKVRVPVQGPACNSSNHLVGWHTFDDSPFLERSAMYIGDRGVVLPRKMEWAGFVLNSRLVWDDTEERPVWVKKLEEVGGDEEEVESPLSMLKDSSVVEPLGSCGRKVMVWWLRVEARADSKFPARWIIDPQLEITVPAKRTPWPDAPPELPFSTERVITNPDAPEKHSTENESIRKRSS